MNRQARYLLASLLLLALLVWLLFKAFQPRNEPRYRITDLGEVDQHGGGFINNRGDILIITRSKDGALQSHYWIKGAKRLPIEALIGVKSYSSASFNNTGQIVGTIYSATDDYKAYLWSATSGLLYLKTPPGMNSWAAAINDQGCIAGSIVDASENGVGCIWESWSEETRLFPIDGSKSIRPVGVAADGTVAGFTWDGQTRHPFVWNREKGFVRIPALDKKGLEPWSINAAGWIVGGTGSGIVEQAFIWNTTNGISVLTQPGGLASRAYDINGNGDTVGESESPSTFDPPRWVREMLTIGGIDKFGRPFLQWVDSRQGYAFIWSGGVLEVLNLLTSLDEGWFLECAYSINDNGQIVGRGIYEGSHHAFLLTPIEGYSL